MTNKLPDGWEDAPLFKYLELVPSGVKQFQGEKTYIDTGSLETGRIRDGVDVDYATRPSRANMGAREGDVLFAKMKDTEKVYLISKEDVNHLYSTGFAILRIKDKTKLLPKYIYFWLRANDFQRLKNKESTGATQKAINETKLKTFKIAVPQIKTQERIIALLEKAEQIKNWRKESNTLSKDYLRSVFVEMFGDPVINAKKWSVVHAIDVCKCIVPGRDKPRAFNGDIPWVTTDDLIPLGNTYTSKKGIGLSNEAIKEVRAKIIPKNSVVMTCVGELGIISIVSEPCVINQQLHSFQCSDKIEPLFLMYNLAFQTPYMHRTATSTTVPYMNKTACNKTPVIMPPLPLQKKFSEMCKKFNEIKLNQEKSMKDADNLFNSMMQKAFKGELV